jgi:hypothetical protein
MKQDFEQIINDIETLVNDYKAKLPEVRKQTTEIFKVLFEQTQQMNDEIENIIGKVGQKVDTQLQSERGIP